MDDVYCPNDIGRLGMEDDFFGGMGDEKRDRLRAESGSQSSMAATPTHPAQLTTSHVNPPPTPQPEDAALANKPWLL